MSDQTRPRGQCRHCLKKPRTIIGRGLCYTCFAQLPVRNLYPSKRGLPKAAAARGPDPDAAEAAAPEPTGRQLTEAEHLRVRWFGGLAA